MAEQIYTPGKGYDDGWDARMRGEDAPPSRGMSVPWDRSMYRDEFERGYWDCHRKIIGDRRKAHGLPRYEE